MRLGAHHSPVLHPWGLVLRPELPRKPAEDWEWEDLLARSSGPRQSVARPNSQGNEKGRSCHNARDLDRLSTEDYATVSPVFPSASKPGYGPALGPSGLGALAARTTKGVYGLGGVESTAQARDCVAHGAAGVAVMGAVMRASDPAATVAALLSAVSS